MTFADFVALFIVVVGGCLIDAIRSIFSQRGSKGSVASVPRWQGHPVHRPFLGVALWKTFPLMVSSTTTKITKTMKFLYHIYIGTSS